MDSSTTSLKLNVEPILQLLEKFDFQGILLKKKIELLDGELRDKERTQKHLGRDYKLYERISTWAFSFLSFLKFLHICDALNTNLTSFKLKIR